MKKRKYKVYGGYKEGWPHIHNQIWKEGEDPMRHEDVSIHHVLSAVVWVFEGLFVAVVILLIIFAITGS